MVLIVAVTALTLAVLGNLISAHVEGSYQRWASKSRWNPVAAASVFVFLATVSAVAVEASAGSRTQRVAKAPQVEGVATFEKAAASAQERLDALRIGMTEQEVVERLGHPTGRFTAPRNPYGIATELVYQSEVAIIQLLLGGAGSVEYFAVTATDAQLKLRTPLVTEYSPPAPKTEYFVLNESPLGDLMNDSMELYGGLGASWMNVAIVWGGSHAANWRYDALGLHSSASRTRRLEPIEEGAPRQEPAELGLYEAFYPQDFDWQAEQEAIESSCMEELLAQTFEPPQDISAWIEIACASHKTHSPANRGRIFASSQWRNFVRLGTFDT